MAEVQKADTSIFGNLQAPKGMSLSEMLGIQKSQYELSKLKELYPAMIAGEQARSRSAQAAATEAEETLQPTIASKKAQSEKTVIGTKQYKTDVLNQTLNALAQDPAIVEGKDANAIVKRISEMRDLAIRRGIPPEEAEIGASHLITSAHQDPASVIQHLGNIRRSQMTPAELQGAIGGQQVVQGTDISGNPTVMVKDPNTGQLIQKPLPVSGNVPNMRIAPTESPTTIANMQESREAAREVANTVAPTLSNINTVLKYLPLAQTGKGGETIAGLQSAFGNLAGSTAEEKAAAARDIIQKNIADLGLQKNAALGGKFVKSLEGAQQSLADAGKNPTAIYKAMQQLKPLIEHSKNYQEGLEKTIDRYGSIQVKRLYDNAMIDAFDPVAISAYDAYKSKNEKDFKEITSGLNEQEKAELGRKMNKYKKLLSGNLE
jgi:hypothetical protein